MNKHSWRHSSFIKHMFLVFLLIPLAMLGMDFKAQKGKATLAVETQEALGLVQEQNSATQSLSALTLLGSDGDILEKQKSVLSFNSDSASFQKPSTCPTYHFVRVGDTLAIIALTYSVSLRDLVEANWIEIPEAIYVGQSLCIPGPVATPTATAVAASPLLPTLVPNTPVPATPGQTVPPPSSKWEAYTVQPGDTLFAIALSHGVSVDVLMEINRIIDARTLQAGQKLQIPGSVITVSPTTVPATASPVVVPTPIPTSNIFAVQFFNNMTLSGTPVFVKTDSVGWSYDWGLNTPATGVNSDFFSASWDGSFAFQAGTHRFTVVADDGVRLHIDGLLVMTHWYDQAANMSHIVDVALTAGTHHVRLEYYDRRKIPLCV